MISSSPGWVLAARITGRPAQRARRDATSGGSTGRGAAPNFMSMQPSTRAPRLSRRRASSLVPGEDEVERAEQRLRRPGRTPPAPGAALRNPRRQQRQPRAAGLRRQEQVRPQLAFDEDTEVRPPVVRNTSHGGGGVDRRVLVDGSGRQPPGHQVRRRPGAGGDQDRGVGPDLPRSRHQRQQGDALADARAVEPQELPVRPRREARPQRSPSRAGSSLPVRTRRASQRRSAGVATAVARAIGAQGEGRRHRAERTSSARLWASCIRLCQRSRVAARASASRG